VREFKKVLAFASLIFGKIGFGAHYIWLTCTPQNSFLINLSFYAGWRCTCALRLDCLGQYEEMPSSCIQFLHSYAPSCPVSSRLCFQSAERRDDLQVTVNSCSLAAWNRFNRSEFWVVFRVKLNPILVFYRHGSLHITPLVIRPCPCVCKSQN